MRRLLNAHKLLDPEIRAKNIRALNYRLKEVYWRVSRPAVPDPVFIVGCSRSGTTVTFETISASAQLLTVGDASSIG